MTPITQRELDEGLAFLATCNANRISGPAALGELYRRMRSASEENPPVVVDFPKDPALDNMTFRCESLLTAARELVFSDLSTKYETTDGELELAINITIRSRRMV